MSDLGDRLEAEIEEIVNKEAWDIPIEQAVLGGFTAALVSGFIDTIFPPKWYEKFLNWVYRHSPKWLRNKWFRLTLQRDSHRETKALMRLIIAGAMGKFPYPIAGSKVASLLLAFDAVKGLTSLDKWAEEASKRIIKVKE